jgi:hypothetical protein
MFFESIGTKTIKGSSSLEIHIKQKDKKSKEFHNVHIGIYERVIRGIPKEESEKRKDSKR